MGKKRIIEVIPINASNYGGILAEMERHRVLEIIIEELSKLIEKSENESNNFSVN